MIYNMSSGTLNLTIYLSSCITVLTVKLKSTSRNTRCLQCC